MSSVAPEPAQPAPSAAEDTERSASPTPYLDRTLPLPHANPSCRPIRPWQTALILLVFVLKTPLQIYLLVLTVISFHEVGHCLAGLLVGLEFDDIRVGPLALDRYKKISWNWNWWTISTGHAGMLPKGGPLLPLRLAVFIVGGPLANAAIGVLSLRVMPRGDSAFLGFVELFAAISFLVAFVNLIPLQRSGFSSDGMRLWMLLFSRKRKRWIFLLNRHSAIRRGDDVPEVKTELIATALADGTSDHVHADWGAYMAAHGKGNHELAARHLEACLSKCSTATPDFRAELILAAARFQSMIRKRPDLAWEWLNCGNPNKSRVNRACTEAVILFYDGKVDEALAKVDEGDKFVAQMPNSGLRTRQQNAWRDLRSLFERDRS